VPFDRLEAPGCFGVFLFGEATRRDAARADRGAVTRAVQLLRDRHPCYYPDYRHGAAAFKVWADALEKWPDKVNAFGNAYNAVVYQELQGFARLFCGRLSKRYPFASRPMDKARADLAKSWQNLERVSLLFPFPEGAGLDDSAKVREAAVLLRECAELNTAAAAALELALGLM
jgi:hypothetical protein